MIAAGTVLAFGGSHPLAIPLSNTAVAVLAVAVFWRTGFPSLSRPAVVVLILILAIPLVQIIPLPRFLLAWVSPMRLALQERLLTPFHLGLGAVPISVNPHATLLAFSKLVCYVLVFVLAFQIHRHRSGASLLVRALIGIGLFEAVYGIVQYLTGWQYIFTYAKVYYTEEATGTYINRNHFAGLLAMVLPFVLAGLLSGLFTDSPHRRRSWAGLLSSSRASRFLRDLVFFALLCLGVFFSRSRMGIVSAMVGLVLVLGVAAWQARRPSVLAVGLIALALPAAYTVWIGPEPVLKRFGELGGPTSFDRLPIWRDTLALVQDYPWMGTGLGTYHWASLHYQSVAQDYLYDHAHNDYLEFAADIGIPVTVILFASLWFLVAKVARLALAVERTDQKILATGCAGAMLALLTHAIADFNFQIPGNALLFCWIAGTAAALSPNARTGLPGRVVTLHREVGPRPLGEF